MIQELSTDKHRLTQMRKLPEGWELKRLKEVCEKITDGTHQTPTYYNEGVIFLSSKNVTSGKIDWENIKYIDNSQHTEMQKRVAPKINDILLAKNGTTGVAAIVDKEIIFDIYVSLALLRPLENLLPTYLLYYINSPLAKNQFNGRLKGIGVPNLHLEEIREVEIPLPPLSEQKRIVAILDEAFTAINKAKANAEKNLANAKELFESYLNGIFSNPGEDWEEKKLGEVCVVERGSSPRPIEKYQTNSPVGVNWIKIGDTKGIDKYIFRTKEKITREGAKKSRYVKEGDFILSNSMSFGKPYIMKTDGYIHDGWFVFRIPNTLDKDYLYNFLIAPFVQDQIQSLGAGAIVKNISGDLVKRVNVYYPNKVHEQKEIVKKLENLSKETKRLEDIYNNILDNLDELKKSFLKKAFEGDL